MSTPSSIVAGPAARTASLDPSRHLYVGTSILLALLVFLGFGRSYWSPLASGTLDLPAAIHVHGVFFFLWTVLFVVQTALASSGRMTLHRELGLAGIALAALMIFTGILANVVTLHADLGGPRAERARVISAHGLSGILMFAAFVTFAFANLRRADWHKRLMILATFSILQPALVRMLQPVFTAVSLPPGFWRLSLVGAIVDALLLIVVALDTRIRGQVHRVYLAGFAFIVAIQCLRTVLMETDAWRAFIGWLGSLAT